MKNRAVQYSLPVLWFGMLFLTTRLYFHVILYMYIHECFGVTKLRSIGLYLGMSDGSPLKVREYKPDATFEIIFIKRKAHRFLFLHVWLTRRVATDQESTQCVIPLVVISTCQVVKAPLTEKQRIRKSCIFWGRSVIVPCRVGHRLDRSNAKSTWDAERACWLYKGTYILLLPSVWLCWAGEKMGTRMAHVSAVANQWDKTCPIPGTILVW